MKRQLGILMALALSVPCAVLPFAGAAAQQNEVNERLLTVSGEGTVRASPDMALITVGVVSENESAREALAANTQSMTQVIETLKGEGIASRDLQTSGFSMEPIYSQPPRNFDNSAPFIAEIVGYRVRNNLSVRVRELSRVGAVLDKVITLGANSVSGPTFSVAEPEPLEDEARRAAIADALRKAELYAQAAGVALGPVFRVEEGYASPPQPMSAPMFRMEAAADASVPIEGGELTFDAQVTVSWRLAE